MSKYKEKQKQLDQETRLDILNRDKFKCALCKAKPVEVHEIIPKSHFGIETMHICFQIRNRIALCRKCHEQVHTRFYREELLAFLQRNHGYDYSDEPFNQYLISREHRNNA